MYAHAYIRIFHALAGPETEVLLVVDEMPEAAPDLGRLHRLLLHVLLQSVWRRMCTLN
jgi:hypothetical protein